MATRTDVDPYEEVLQAAPWVRAGQTLLISREWAGQHCIVPDGFEKGDRFELVGWQAWALLNFYRVKPTARVGQLAPAFHHRRAQIVLPQKAGKAPYTAAHICVEGVGPALFAGWARGGETWDCRQHGCDCGWVYEYQPGEAMGMRWPTPLIQITATSEDQTDNIYDALRPMIDDGPLAELIPKTGEEFIRLPGGRIDVVTSNARSRLGQRVTFVPQDETGFWTPDAGMIKVAEVQRRGLAGMGGRAEETTNAWDPNEGSVAQRTADAAERTGDIFRLHPEAPRGLSYANKAERRKIHRVVYQGCRWIDLDAIESEAAELLTVDPTQAERFFGNRSVAGSGAAFDLTAFERLARPRKVPKTAVITIGIDGARHDDALAVVATDVKSGYQWPLGIWERPPDADDSYEHPLHEVTQAVSEAFETWTVWRAYIDPQWIDPVVTALQNRYGDKRVLVWETYRPRAIAWAVRNYEQAIGAGDVSHDGDKTFTRHVANARRRMLNVRDDRERFMHTLSKDSIRSPRKIDAAMAAVLSWEARGDAIAAGVYVGDDPPPPKPPAPDVYSAGHAPAASAFVIGVQQGGMSDME